MYTLIYLKNVNPNIVIVAVETLRVLTGGRGRFSNYFVYLTL